ncbi:MAG: hypothetical protein GX893_04785 [Firmicutes bacterium]|nr:hypothetical protein [Bacillota bacterium]
MKCPLCGGIDTGKVGTNQYYCWNCLLEFSMDGPDGFTAYYVDEEGTLISLAEMELMQSNKQPEETVLG